MSLPLARPLWLGYRQREKSRNSPEGANGSGSQSRSEPATPRGHKEAIERQLSPENTVGCGISLLHAFQREHGSNSPLLAVNRIPSIGEGNDNRTADNTHGDLGGWIQGSSSRKDLIPTMNQLVQVTFQNDTSRIPVEYNAISVQMLFRYCSCTRFDGAMSRMCTPLSAQ